ELNGDPNGFPSKDEISQYLKDYALSFNLPIKHNTNVTNVQKNKNIYYVSTEHMEYKAENIIIATGPFQKPRTPDFQTIYRKRLFSCIPRNIKTLLN
ncbi:NAD(P)-binding domain-containing protein, partial [Microbulbifer pacificus]